MVTMPEHLAFHVDQRPAHCRDWLPRRTGSGCSFLLSSGDGRMLRPDTTPADTEARCRKPTVATRSPGIRSVVEAAQ
jgi:hypothetical protein